MGRKLYGALMIALAAFLVLAWTPGPAQAAETIKLVFQNNYPTKHSRLGVKIVGAWLDEVEKASKGKIKFERHWAGEPLPAKEALDGLSKGVIDGLCAFPPYYSGKVAIADICAMPQNFKNPQDVYDLWFNGGLGQLVDKVYQKRAGVKVLFPVIFAPENFQVSKKAKKVRNFADFKGMKIRAGGGMLMATVKAIGASPVFTHSGEYYTAMQRGTIDAGLMATYSLETYKMWEVADQVVNPPIMNNCFVLVYMGLRRWNKMGPELQKVLIDSAKKLSPSWIKHITTDDERITKLAQEKGVQFYVLPKPEQKKMWDATESVWDLYVKTCAKQGAEAEAKKIRALIKKRFLAE
ncbi:MAG: TRAP transporter substrate-binding protein DctP [Thermodesulfobacteriota bacterium]